MSEINRRQYLEIDSVRNERTREIKKVRQRWKDEKTGRKQDRGKREMVVVAQTSATTHILTTTDF